MASGVKRSWRRQYTPSAVRSKSNATARILEVAHIMTTEAVTEIAEPGAIGIGQHQESRNFDSAHGENEHIRPYPTAAARSVHDFSGLDTLTACPPHEPQAARPEQRSHVLRGMNPWAITPAA